MGEVANDRVLSWQEFCWWWSGVCVCYRVNGPNQRQKGWRSYWRRSCRKWRARIYSGCLKFWIATLIRRSKIWANPSRITIWAATTTPRIMRTSSPRMRQQSNTRRRDLRGRGSTNQQTRKTSACRRARAPTQPPSLHLRRSRNCRLLLELIKLPRAESFRLIIPTKVRTSFTISHTRVESFFALIAFTYNKRNKSKKEKVLLITLNTDH